MDVYVEVSLDRGPLARGLATERWFTHGLAVLFSDLVESGAEQYAVMNREEFAPAERFGGEGGGMAEFVAGTRTGPYYGCVGFSESDEQSGFIGTGTALMEGMSTLNTAGISAGPSRLADSGFCAEIVKFLLDALATADPAFGRVEAGQFTERTNLDVVLRRKVTESMANGREMLRGYAWVTIIPQELVERLGGWEELESGGAFFRVLPLPGGGGILQASETLSDYTDEVMRRIFEKLAPVLPTGTPEVHPAYPEIRFVPRDAGELRER